MIQSGEGVSLASSELHLPLWIVCRVVSRPATDFRDRGIDGTATHVSQR